MNKQVLLSLYVLSLLVISIDGSNNGEKSFTIAMERTTSRKLSPQPLIADPENLYGGSKARGVCKQSTSYTCRGSPTPCYCCIGPGTYVCMHDYELCKAVCS
ncbi:hypothetical protein LXL04_002674 [Taraxacum kok-saghyz]